MTSVALQDLRDALRLRSATQSISNSRRRIGQHLALCIDDHDLRTLLLHCNKYSRCNRVCCPTCARARSVRYLNTSLRPAIDTILPNDLRFITINLGDVASLDEADGLFAYEHGVLKRLVSGINMSDANRWLPANLRFWGWLEVQAVLQPDGAIWWRCHWHCLVALGWVTSDFLGTALRARWPAAHAVRIDRVRGAEYDHQYHSEFRESVTKIACYASKVCLTIRRSDGKREWLPPHAIAAFIAWRMAHPSNWSRFGIGRAERSSS